MITVSGDPINAVTQLARYTEQIRRLEFTFDFWADVERFLEVNSGPLPLLHTLELNIEFSLEGWSDVISPLSLPSFARATNVRKFFLSSEVPLPFHHFAFPTNYL